MRAFTQEPIGRDRLRNVIWRKKEDEALVRSVFDLSEVVRFLHDCDGAMIIAVFAVTMMYPAVDQKIDMIVVRNCLVTAIRVVTLTVRRCATRRIHLVCLQDTFVDVRIMDRMKMTAVNKVDMVAVLDLCMSAICAVNVGVVGMNCVFHKLKLLFVPCISSNQMRGSTIRC